MRIVSLLLGFLSLTGAAFAQDWDPKITEFDRVMGSPDAPVTIIEYASFTCPHCAAFHNQTLPALKEQYIDTGKARLVFRDFPLNRVDLRAGQLARCLPEERYFAMIEVLFTSQAQWRDSGDPEQNLAQMAGLAGLPPDQAQTCIQNEELANRIAQLQIDAQAQYDVSGTPTFIINGERFEGAPTIETLGEAIDEAAE